MSGAPMPPGREPQQVRVVNFAKLFGTLIASILTAVALLAAFSQITGYSAYTGDELESHRAERIQKELEEAEREARELEAPPEPEPEPEPESEGRSSRPEPTTYEECVSHPDYQLHECEAFR